MPSAAAAPASERPRRPRRRRKSRMSYLILGVATIAAGSLAAKWFFARPVATHSLPGFVGSARVVLQEYGKFKGKSPNGGNVADQFEHAATLQTHGDYQGALAVLEPLSKDAAVPVVFNDLGVLYAALHDRSRAVNAFREALARDIDYLPVRENLDRLQAQPKSVDPVTAEVEPNDTNEYANYVGLNKPVDAQISAANADVDCFRFVTPPAPRDRIEVSIVNRSKTLAPRIRFFDQEGAFLPWEKTVREPGGSLSLIIAPQPNVPLYIHVFGEDATGGAYTLLVKPLKQFDAYEPNDDIYIAHKVNVGDKIDANIMDADDTDYYSFVAEKSGEASIDIENRSTTLIPALTTFTSDMRTSGFGPDVHAPGESLHHHIQVLEGQTYYLQVWSVAKSFGDYSLKVSQTK